MNFYFLLLSRMRILNLRFWVLFTKMQVLIYFVILFSKFCLLKSKVFLNIHIHFQTHLSYFPEWPQYILIQHKHSIGIPYIENIC